MNFRKSFRSFAIAAAIAVPAALVPVQQAHAGIILQIGIAPPALPVYAQPVCPGDGYIWTPGYWAYGDEGYFWVPGTWVIAPTPGYLWTPAYWGWEGGFYRFHAGYWGPHIGFYGGINYGFGYFGTGFEGGYWRANHFYYNTAYARFGGGFHPTNVYVHNVTIVNRTNVSYNGGRGGVEYHARPEELNAMHERHVEATHEQMEHQTFASSNRQQFASVNHGNPGVAAAATPAAFHANPNNPVGASRPVVNQREGNQQQRIANGVNSGRMTSGEAARADQRQANIDRQVHNDRVANGGALTPQERGQVNREQNAASNQIYRENHNARTQPQAQPAPQRQAAQPQAQRPAPQQQAPRAEARPAPQAAPRNEGGGHGEEHRPR